MTIVLDASGAVEIALEKERAESFLKFLKTADLIISPDIYISEVTNVFWKYRKFQQLTDDICKKGIEFCVNLIDDYIPSSDLWKESYYEGVRNNSSTYDMFYLVTAKRSFGKIISMDKKLNELAVKEGLAI